MCGLWGVVAKNNITNEQFDLFRELGVVSTLRGYDSSGVALASRTKKKGFFYNWFRDTEPACLLVWNPAVRDFFNKSHNPLVLMGHARAATIGSVTRENAHPFRTDKLLGMHNGTIPSLREKDITDSQVLYEKIDKDGLEPTIAAIKGPKAYALTWFDRSNGTFNILRNTERTLFCVYSNDQRIMVYASDYSFLELISARYPHFKFTDPMPFEMDQHHCFKHGEIVPTKTKVRDYIPFLPAPARPPVGPIWRSPGNQEKRAMMEALQSETTPEKNTNIGLKPEDLKPGSTTTVEVIPPTKSVAGSKETSMAERIKPPTLVPDNELSTVNTIDEPSLLFKNKLTFLPPKVLVNKVIKHLMYRMHDGRYVFPSGVAHLLAEGCAYSGAEANFHDKIVWISPDAYVLEEHTREPFVLHCLAAYGHTDFVPGGSFYLSLSKLKEFRAAQNQLTF